MVHSKKHTTMYCILLLKSIIFYCVFYLLQVNYSVVFKWFACILFCCILLYFTVNTLYFILEIAPSNKKKNYHKNNNQDWFDGREVAEMIHDFYELNLKQKINKLIEL